MEGAAGRCVGGVTVGGFGHRSEPELGEVEFEAVEQPRRVGAGTADGVNVGADEPRPHCALVVGAVALGRAAAVTAAVGGVPG